jgi:uncharacterized protein (TIGR02246 family)
VLQYLFLQACARELERRGNRMLRPISILLLALAQQPPSSPPPGDASDEAAIRTIVAEQVVAWNTGDGKRYAERLAPDASFTNIYGMVMYGSSAFEKRHSQILATFYKGTTKHHAVRRVRFVTPDVAIVDIDNEVRGVKSMPEGIFVPPDGIVKTQLMQVFVRRSGNWWIEAYHNVDLKPSRQP